MAAVRIISESTVRAMATPPTESTRRVELTPWDLQLLLVDYIQKGLLFSKPPAGARDDPDSQNGVIPINAVDHLKTSLSRALSYFFPLAGRLSSTPHDGASASFSVECNNAGALFVHAVVDSVTADDILGSVYTPAVVKSFFPLNEVLSYEGISKPLLGVQVNELADGGMFLACCVNHAVADGTSFWNFFNSWSELARTSSGQISRPPILERWFLHDSHCPVKIPHSEIPDVRTPNLQSLIPRFVSPVPLKERVFNFKRGKLQDLKAKANGELGSTKISSLQALLAHLWRAVTRVRQIRPDLETSYRLLVGGRPRLRPPLPEDYFGNAVVGAMATVKAGDLQTQGLGFAAAEMNKVVASQTEKEMRRFLERWVEDPKLWRVGITANGILTGSSTRFNVYGNDFGWGMPAAVHSGCGNKFDGKMTVFQGKEEGSIDIEACLLPETVEALGKDEEFMEAVTV